MLKLLPKDGWVAALVNKAGSVNLSAYNANATILAAFSDTMPNGLSTTFVIRGDFSKNETSGTLWLKNSQTDSTIPVLVDVSEIAGTSNSGALPGDTNGVHHLTEKDGFVQVLNNSTGKLQFLVPAYPHSIQVCYSTSVPTHLSDWFTVQLNKDFIVMSPATVWVYAKDHTSSPVQIVVQRITSVVDDTTLTVTSGASIVPGQPGGPDITGVFIPVPGLENQNLTIERNVLTNPSTGRIDFTDVQSLFLQDEATYGTAMRCWKAYDKYYSIYNGVVLYRQTNGDWGLTQGYDVVNVGCKNPTMRIVNGTTPLFITKDNGSFIPADPSIIVGSSDKLPPVFFNAVPGATARLEFITPLTFQYFIIHELAAFNGTSSVVYPVEYTVTYIDDSTHTFISSISSATIYLDRFDYKKQIKHIDINYYPNESFEAGIELSWRINTSTGKLFYEPEVSQEYDMSTPTFVVDYVYGYSMGESFRIEGGDPYAQLLDITDQFTFITSLAADASFPLSNLFDNDPSTYYKTTATTATLTLTGSASNNKYYHVDRIEVDLPWDTMDNDTLNYQQSIAALTLNLWIGPVGTARAATNRFKITTPTGVRTLITRQLKGAVMDHMVTRLSAVITRSATRKHTISALRVYGYEINF
jgi:hypothetical protein